MLAHAMVHTYELSIPIFVSIWLVEFDVIDFGIAQFGVTAATLGLVVTAGYGLFGVGALPGGVLVDRVGSRRLIVLCLFGMGASFLLLGVAPGLAVVALALVVWGAAASVYHPAGLTLISKGVEERGTGFAYHGIAGNLGIGLGPLATALLLLVFDWSLVAVLLAVPALVAGLFAMRADVDEEAAVGDDDGKGSTGVDSLGEFFTASRSLLVGAFVVVFAVVMSSGLYYRGVLTFLPGLLESLPGFEPIPLGSLVPGLAAEGRTLRPERYFYSGLLIVGVVGQYAGGKLTDRVPVEWGLVGAFVGLFVIGVAFLPLATAGVVPLLAIGAALGFTLFFAQPFYQATVAEYTPSGLRGLSYGYTYLGVFGVGALGGVLAGAVLTYANPPTLFAILAGIALFGLSMGLYLARRSRRAGGPIEA